MPIPNGIGSFFYIDAWWVFNDPVKMYHKMMIQKNPDELYR